MNSFKNVLAKKILDSNTNSYGVDNIGGYHPEKPNFYERLKWLVKRKIERYRVNKYGSLFESIYQSFSEPSKSLLIEVLAYRLLGREKVRLSVNTPAYRNKLEELKKVQRPAEPDAFKLFSGLRKFDLREMGYDLTLDYHAEGIMMDFVLEQYACRVGENKIVEVKPNDIVLDIGGCWGDTALYFADKVGPTGRIFSFEFIPRNILVHSTNVRINPHLSDRIELVKNPVFNKSELEVYYQDKGAGSKVRMTPFKGQTGSVKTITVDDFVLRNGIEKIDFIKMDIEGAETFALEGARKTIEKFKPKLAIAIYHSVYDMAHIPKWILDLNLDYKIHLGHYTIFEDETVCFASIN